MISRSVIGQITRFAGIGVLATVVHVMVAVLAGRAFALDPMAANLTGFCVAFGISYLGHARFTFRVGSPNATHLRRFLTLSALSLLLSSCITALATQAGATLAQAMLCVGVLVPIASFIGARFWAFSEGART